MALEHKFRGRARVAAAVSVSPAGSHHVEGVGDLPIYSVTVAAITEAASLLPAGNAATPAVLSFAIAPNVFNELKNPAAPANTSNQTNAELADSVVRSWPILVIGGSGTNLNVVFLPGGDIFPSSPPVAIPFTVQYPRDAATAELTKTNFPYLFPKNLGTTVDAAADAIIGQLNISATVLPHSLLFGEGKMAIDLLPTTHDTFSIGTVASSLKNVFAGVIQGISKVKTVLLELGTTPVAAADNTVVGAAGQTLIPKVAATDSAAERTLLTTKTAAGITQRNPAGSITVVAGGRNPPVYTLPAAEGLPVSVSSNLIYPYSGGVSGEAVHIAEFTAGASCTLWAESLAHFNMFYVGTAQIVPAVGGFANARINYFGDAVPETALSASAGTVTIAAEADGWYSASFTPEAKITTIAEMTAVLRAATPGITAYTTQGVIVTPALLAGYLQAQKITIRGIPQPQLNLTAIAAPTADDDEDKGYSIGSQWQNNTTGVLYRAISVTAAAAEWGIVNRAADLIWETGDTAGTLKDDFSFSDYRLINIHSNLGLFSISTDGAAIDNFVLAQTTYGKVSSVTTGGGQQGTTTTTTLSITNESHKISLTVDDGFTISRTETSNGNIRSAAFSGTSGTATSLVIEKIIGIK